MSRESVRRVRLSLYLPNERLKKQMKQAAARRNLTLTAYCTQAITRQVAQDLQGVLTIEEVLEQLRLLRSEIKGKRKRRWRSEELDKMREERADAVAGLR